MGPLPASTGTLDGLLVPARLHAGRNLAGVGNFVRGWVVRPAVIRAGGMQPAEVGGGRQR